VGIVAELTGTPYLILVYLHIFAAAVWIGGSFYFHYKLTLLRRANDVAGMVATGRETEIVGTKLFAPAAGIVLLMGILMVAFGPWGFDLWIVLALIGYAVTFATGMFFIGPTATKVATAVEEKGIDSPEVASQMGRLMTIARLDYLVLLLILLDMVFKPGAS
jgi:uncharacterized membrane protein